MSGSATSSEARGTALAALALGATLAVSAAAASLPSPDEALSLAFPGARVERENVFLDDDQAAAVERLAGAGRPSRLVTRFRASTGDRVEGWAYLDTHRVRTLPETLLVILAADGSVRRVEVVAFREPPDYLPPEGWYRQLDGHRLGPELSLGRAIRPITGATLTAQATTAATRRVLALHALLLGPATGEPGG